MNEPLVYYVPLFTDQLKSSDLFCFIASGGIQCLRETRDRKPFQCHEAGNGCMDWPSKCTWVGGSHIDMCLPFGVLFRKFWCSDRGGGGFIADEGTRFT